MAEREGITPISERTGSRLLNLRVEKARKGGDVLLDFLLENSKVYKGSLLRLLKAMGSERNGAIFGCLDDKDMTDPLVILIRRQSRPAVTLEILDGLADLPNRPALLRVDAFTQDHGVDGVGSHLVFKPGGVSFEAASTKGQRYGFLHAELVHRAGRQMGDEIRANDRYLRNQVRDKGRLK